MPSPFRWAVLAAAVAAFMQTHLHRMAYAPLIPTFVDDLGLTYAAAGTLQTAYFWTYTAVQIPVGILADRWGSRRVMLASMAVLVAGALTFAASRTYAEAIGARMLVGLGAAAVWVPGMRLITEWFPREERGRATGLMSSGGGLGGTLGLVIVPWVASAYGWRTAYAALVAPAVLVLVVIATLLRRDVSGGPAAPRAAAGNLGRVLATASLWPLNLAVLFSYGGYFSFVTFLPAYLVKALALSETEAGLVTGLITAGTVVSWPVAGALSDRMGRRKPIYLVSQGTSALVCVAFALAVPSLGAGGAAVTALAAGLLIGGMILPFVAIVEMFPRQGAATAAGVANTACFVGGMILPVVLGHVVDLTGSFATAFLVAAAVQGVALVFGAFMLETGARAGTAGR